MGSKFYKGQSLWAIDPCVMQNGENQGKPTLTIGKEYVNEYHYGGVCIIDDFGDPHSFGAEPLKYFSLTPPRTILTEWQRKRLMQCTWNTNKWIMEDIESILSEPEPPKFVPKEGDAVLVRWNKSDYWKAAVFNNMEYKEYKCYGFLAMPYCIPFDPALVGTVTND